MIRSWSRRLVGCSMTALAALALVFSIHAGACVEHDHDDQGSDGSAPTHLVCHCSCHAATVPGDVAPSIPTATCQPMAGAFEQRDLVSAVIEIDPPTDKRSA